MNRFPVPGARTLAVSLLAATLAACGGGSDPAPSAVLGAAEANAGSGTPTSPTAPKSIVETAASLPQFSSLVAALRFASDGDDLVRLLSGAGTFTVFAPTNDAFDALARELTRNPSATAADLLVPANKALVRAVLQYHVLGATVRKADVPLGAAIDPVLAGGDTFRIDASGDALVITDGRVRTARIVATDVGATNGVIHVIDKVILPAAPAADRTIVEIASGNENLSTLVEAVLFASENGDLATLLSGPGSFTVFAPTNAAFGKLPAGTVDTLVKPENKGTLTKILTYHVVPGKLAASDLKDGMKLKTAEGEQLTVKHQGDKVWIIDAKGGQSMVTISNVNQSNGVIHVVDKVILPAA